jgi:hypothetical protein
VFSVLLCARNHISHLRLNYGCEIDIMWPGEAGTSEELWSIEVFVVRQVAVADSSDRLQQLASCVETLAEGVGVSLSWDLARELADLAIERRKHETATAYLERARSLAKDHEVDCQSQSTFWLKSCLSTSRASLACKSWRKPSGLVMYCYD